MNSDRETVRIHLRLLDEDHTVAVEVPLGRLTLPDLLPTARQLTDQVTALILDHYRAAGTPPSCGRRCVACCNCLVALSLPEAVGLADWVASLPAERQTAVRARFAAVLRRLEEAGLLTRTGVDGEPILTAVRRGNHELSRRFFALQVPCPLLEDGLCSVYEQRPAVCREHHVISPPQRCSDLEHAGVLRVAPRLEMTGALARVTGQLPGQRPCTIPLPPALEWGARHGDAIRQRYDSLELLGGLLRAVDPRCHEPFAARGES